MKYSRLSVFIIETPNSIRSVPLKNSLVGDPRISVHTIEASMISTQLELEKSAIKFEMEYFWALTNRYLSLPEIGCANSHNMARLRCSLLDIGGVILEDDARILDLDNFVKSSLFFLEKFNGTSSILSLTHSPGIKRVKKSRDISRLVGLFGDAPLAVAYAITPLAACRLLHANDPVKFVSDWPEIEVKNYCLLEPPVSHGDSSTQSTIDPSGVLGRSGRSLQNTFRKITLLDYFFRAKSYVKFSSYFSFNVLKPVRIHVDSLRFFIIRNF